MVKLPTEILWHEGMLLLPQHFQQQATRQEMVLNWRVGSVVRDAWGIISIDIDQSAIIHGLLRVEKIEAVMPDGFIVQYPGEHYDPIELDLSPHIDELRSAPGRIYLVLPRISNEAAGTRGGLPRYKAYQGTPVVDAHTGDNEAIMERCAPNLSLMIGSEPADQFTVLPIAEVSCRDETYSITEYLPPTLRLHPTTPLGQKLASLAKRMREKAVFLQQRINGLIAEGANDQAGDLKQALYAITDNLPEFELLIGSRSSHPFQLYSHLARTIGSISIMHRNFMPPTLRPYDHIDMTMAFNEVIDFCDECLDSIQERYKVVVFDEIDIGFSLTEHLGTESNIIILGVRLRPAQSEEDIIKWMNSAIIAPSSKINEMVERRVRGATRQRVERETSMDLLQSKEVILFAVERDKISETGENDLRVINMLPAMQHFKPLEITLFKMNTD